MPPGLMPAAWLYGLFFRLVVTTQAPDPDIAEALAAVVILQHEGLFGCLGLVFRGVAMGRDSHNLFAVVEQDAVQEDSEIARFHELFAIERAVRQDSSA